MDEALIAVRVVQLASTAITAGVLIFPVFVAGPVFRAAAEPGNADVFSTWNCRIAWTGLALIALSGIAWLVLQTSAMSGRPLGEALADGLIWVVLSQNSFWGGVDCSRRDPGFVGGLADLALDTVSVVWRTDALSCSCGRDCLDGARSRDCRTDRSDPPRG